jgi:hypothetical protein
MVTIINSYITEEMKEPGEDPVEFPTHFYLKDNTKVAHKKINREELIIFWHQFLNKKQFLKCQLTFDLKYWLFLFRGSKSALRLNYSEVGSETRILITRRIPETANFFINSHLWTQKTPFIQIEWGKYLNHEFKLPMVLMKNSNTKTFNKYRQFVETEAQPVLESLRNTNKPSNTTRVVPVNTPPVQDQARLDKLEKLKKFLWENQGVWKIIGIVKIVSGNNNYQCQVGDDVKHVIVQIQEKEKKGENKGEKKTFPFEIKKSKEKLLLPAHRIALQNCIAEYSKGNGQPFICLENI